MNLLRPLLNRLRRAGGGEQDFMALAESTWEIAHGESRRFPAAISLPGQLDRIRNTVFASVPETHQALTATGTQEVAPTMAFRFRDVDLVDGVLYKGSAEFHLRPRCSRMPLTRRPKTSVSGAIYDSWIGLRYFGNWLMDDCETYRLAERLGQPVTLRRDSAGHRAAYESRLGINPLRVESAHFDELVLFYDLPNNADKCARAADRRLRLLAGHKPLAHPGVFLLRGATGDPRFLRNELALAEDLHRRHGIRVLNAEDHTVDDLVAACAGARLAIGVEGSHLTHALAAMPPGSTFLALFPPDRVTAAMKLMTDRLDQHFALVIGAGTAEGFDVSLDEVEATMERIP